MTLKEKIKDVDIEKGMSDRIEQIADDYAIEFAEWLDLDDTQDLIHSLQMVGELPKIPKTKELLQIFKKDYEKLV